jgi:hypothetical protein
LHLSSSQVKNYTDVKKKSVVMSKEKT